MNKNEDQRIYYLGEKYACLKHYSGGSPVCAHEDCNERDLDLLTIDHKDNNGKQERDQFSHGHAGVQYYRSLRKRGYPDDLNLQVLCRKHNMEKERPHTRKLRILVEFDSVDPIQSIEIKTLWEEPNG